jgi:hypothetical protein
MIQHDERTEAEHETHPLAVVMTDAFMSGWGKAEGGASFAAWACRPDDVDAVERWVRRRGEARRVRVVTLKGWKPQAAHTTVYVVRPGHPSIRTAAAALRESEVTT